LEGIEAAADVTDATNVTAAGAVMKSGGANSRMDSGAHIEFGDANKYVHNVGNAVQVVSKNSNSVLSGSTGAYTAHNAFINDAGDWKSIASGTCLLIGPDGSGPSFYTYTASGADETITWSTRYNLYHQGNDGTGSGLDADLLDGQEGSYYRDADNINAGTLAVARLHSSVWRSDNDGSGSGLDADLLDGQEGSYYLDANSIQDQGGGTSLKCKVVDIGDWDMDATGGVNVAHGLTLGNIRNIDVLIRKDSGEAYSLIAGFGSSQSGYYSTDATNVVLYRVTSGYFDSVDYNSTSYNRGWVTIWYV